MFAVSKSQYLVSFDGSFTIAASSTVPPVSTNESKDYKMKLEKTLISCKTWSVFYIHMIERNLINFSSGVCSRDILNDLISNDRY